MTPRRWSLALGSVVALGLAGCSSSGSGAVKVTTTVPRSGTTRLSAAPTVATIATTATTPAPAVLPASVTPTVAPTVAPDAGAATSPATRAPAPTAAGRTVTSPSDNVKLGDSGAGVRQIQSALAARGYAVTVDGKFGNQTVTAVKAFQTKNGLTADGVVGPATWAKLQTAAAAAPTTVAKPTGTTAKATTTTVKVTPTTVKR